MTENPYAALRFALKATNLRPIPLMAVCVRLIGEINAERQVESIVRDRRLMPQKPRKKAKVKR